MKTVKASCAHEQMRNDMLHLMRTKYADMPADEILGVVSVLLGQLIAFQDRRRFTPDVVMRMVSANIEAGNRMAIDEFLGKPAGSA